MLKFILVKLKVGYDISDIVEKVTWSGRKNSPARSVQLQLLDDPDLGEGNRPDIDVYEGHHLIFLEDDKELFRGIIMSQSRSQDRKLTVTAYDSAIYLSNNKDSFSYTKKTLTEIFLDICKRYGLQGARLQLLTIRSRRYQRSIPRYTISCAWRCRRLIKQRESGIIFSQRMTSFIFYGARSRLQSLCLRQGRRTVSTAT